MTEKDVKRLKRVELLEMLIEQTEENEKLKAKITELEAQLANRVLVMEKAGTIAGASLELSGVFTQAQDAADRYLSSIRKMQEDTEAQTAARIKETEENCAEAERRTRDLCERLVAEAKEKVRVMEERCRLLDPERLEAIDHPAPAPVEEEPEPSKPRRRFGRH